MSYCTETIERARMCIYNAIDHLDEARGMYCAKGNPDKAILSAMADFQDELAELREKIKELKEAVE